MTDRIFAFFNIQSLKGRLRFWFILLILILVLLSSIPFILIGKEHKEEEVQATIGQMINLQQLVIEQWLAERMSNILTIASLPVVRSRGEGRLKEAFEAFNLNHQEFDAIVFINKEGITEFDTLGPVGIDLSDRIYFQEAQKGNTYVSDLIVSRQTNNQVIIFSAPVFDYEQEFLGLVFGSVNLEKINAVMDQFQSSPTRATYLINREGLLITDSRINVKGEIVDSEILKLALDGSIIQQSITDSQGKKVFGDYRWVNDKWLIIGEVNESEAFKSYYGMAMMFSIIILFVLIIAFILMIVVSNRIESPIHKVLEGTRRMGEGVFNYRLEPNSYKENAIELRELCDNFNKMGELIENHIDSLEKSEERFRMIAEYSSDMITIHDSTGKTLYVSPSGKDILDYDDDEVIGLDAYLFIHPDDIEEYKKNYKTLLDTGYVVSAYRIRRKDGIYIWFESSSRCLHGKNPEEPQLIVVSRNITERKAMEQKLQEANEVLQQQAIVDGLTGVGNRRSFDAVIEVEWNRAIRNSTPISLIMIDIDYFKEYNDTYGHIKGDSCLKKVAETISGVVSRSSDLVCRYGGEEFIVILPETDEVGVQHVAENIRSVVEALKIPHKGSQISTFITISIGTATMIPKKNKHFEDLIEAVDKALYQAKQDGRNLIRSYKSDE